MIKNIERTRDGVDSLIDHARDVVIGAADGAERGVESGAERVAGSARAAGDYVRDGAETASRGAHRSIKSTAKALDRGYARASGDLTRAAAAVSDYVTENPGKTLLVVASVGYLLGSLRRRQVSA